MKKKKLINYLILFIPIIILIIMSLLNMYKIGINNNSYKSYLLKQSIWFSIGFIVMLIIMFIKPNKIFKYSKYLYYFNVLLLILVLFFGKTINGSRAWFDFHYFSFQPSELMKYSLTLYLSNIMSNFKKHDFKTEIKFILKYLY